MNRTRTETIIGPRPSISENDQNNQNQTPTIEDQIRNYRRGHRLRQEISRRLPGRRQIGYNRSLESQLNPDAELDISQFRRAQSVPAETLYQGGWTATQHRVYQHYSDQRILVTDGQQLELPFITQQSYDEVRRSGYQHLHIGLIMIRLYTLHRRNAGVNALVVIRDTRWADDRSIIGTMEMDLTTGTQLAYLAPNLMLSITDFFNHIQLVIQTHGYENWQAGESNLLLTRSLIGRLSNTSYTSFRYNVQRVSDYLASRGVQAIPGRSHTTESLRGLQWVIRPPSVAEVQHPQEAVIRTRSNRSVLLKFKNYAATKPNEETSVGANDEEQLSDGEMPQETALVLFVNVSDNEDEEDDEEDTYWQSIQLIASLAEVEEPIEINNEPVWDDEPVWDKDESDEFINPFAEGGGDDNKFKNLKQETVYVLGQEPETDYPILKQFMEKPTKHHAMSSSSITSNYNVPPEPTMGLRNYPPGSLRNDHEAGGSRGGYQRPRGLPGGIGRHQNEQWNLPTAMQEQGAMLVLPEDIGLYNDVISRWESITLNLISERNFDNNKSKMQFIENLLGEVEKKIWIQWRMAFEAEYLNLEAIADDTQNVISQIRRVLILEDPYQGTTDEQDRAYQDLERLSCEHVKDLFLYMNDFKVLAAKSGRMYLSPELSEKFFRKMPPLIGKELEEAFRRKFPMNTVGVIPRIHFSYQYLAEMCKKAALQRSLKDLTICSKITIPGYYQNNRKKYGLRKAKTYKGKPHDSHVRVFKRKHQDRVRKCKCFICGEEGHFARDCRSKNGHMARAAIMNDLDLPDDLDVVSVDLNEPDSDAICSLSEGEAGRTEYQVRTAIEELPLELNFMLQIKDFGWRSKVELPKEQEECTHVFKDTEIQRNCSFCKLIIKPEYGKTCEECNLQVCSLCAPFYFGIQIKPKAAIQSKPYNNKDALIKELTNYIVYLENENERLKQALAEERKKNLNEEDLEKEFNDLIISEKERKGKITIEEEEIEEETAKVLFEFREPSCKAETVESSTLTPPRQKKKIFNQLYNLVVTFEIPGIKPFDIRAILDTGATNCSIDQLAVPEEALELSPYPVQIVGVNSTQIATKKLKGGQMIVGENKFRIPFTYSFPMGLGIQDGIQMLIGCNFIRSMQGGLRIEGTILTFYKNVTVVQTTTETVAHTVAIEELGLDEIEYVTIQDALYHQSTITNPKFEKRFGSLLSRLKEQGFIGNDPLKHWQKNKVVCKLDLINPNLTIEDKPLKHVTPLMKEQFDRHIKALLEIGVIRPSTSKHRTMAFIVNSGTSIDPKTGKEIKGKERMVLNYRTLNDNTNKDQYSLPGINTILKKISNSRIFSKFDLKSGFHQVAMSPESIPWTAFIVPGGLYEWLVMPFGLKNAPAIFQRKMDNCFKGTEAFIAVYIDDILVFSENEEQHAGHLEVMLDICEKHGLVLSPTKMKIAVPEIDFLGAQINRGKIRLQPHIIKKIANFDIEQLKEKKGLRSWLGILNYARSYIPKLGVLLGPLYSKVSPHGDKRLKSSDIQLIKQIQELVQNLPDLSFPPEDSYIVLETDGCMEGWGGVCKWKPRKHDPRSAEQVCAYASGKFETIKSTIDAEIHACMETLSAMKIHYLDKPEITLRTDCQAIISFYNKSSNNKPSRLRWVKFVDFVTGTGVQVHFEHIEGRLNTLADTLSRLTTLALNTRCLNNNQEIMLEKLGPVLDELSNSEENNMPVPEEQVRSLQQRIEKVFPLTMQTSYMQHSSKNCTNQTKTLNSIYKPHKDCPTPKKCMCETPWWTYNN
jgi:ribonuclease HI